MKESRLQAALWNRLRISITSLQVQEKSPTSAQSAASCIRIEHLGGLGSLGAEIRPPLTSPGFKQNWGKLGPQA